MAPSPAAPPTPRRTSGRRVTTSTPPRASILIAEALFGDKPIKRRKSNEVVEDKAGALAELLKDKSKPKRQTIDFGRAFGAPSPNSVQDRVRKWQAQGGGVINQRDPSLYPPEATPVVSEEGTDRELDENGEPFQFNGPMKTRTRKDAKIKAREEAKKAEEEAKAAAEAKILFSPKKRVVSDSNWRKRQINAGDGRSGMGQKRYTSSSPPPEDDGIRIKPEKEDSSARREKKRAEEAERATADDGIRITPSGETSDVRKHWRKDEQRTPSRTFLESDTVKGYSSSRKDSTRLRPKQSGKDRRRSSGSRQDDGSYIDRPSSRTTFSAGNSRSGGSKESTPKKWSPTSAAALNARKYTETVKRKRRSTSRDRTPEHIDGPTRNFSPRQAPKSNILREVYDEGKKIFAKAPEPPLVNHTGNRIEAWLSETPDPFTDDPPESVVGAARPDPDAGFHIPPIKEEVIVEERSPYPDLSKPEKPERRSGSWTGSGRRRRRARSSSVNEDEKIPDERPSLHSFQSTPVERERQGSPNVVKDAPSLTPPSLKRVGAKRSSPTRPRRKSSPLKEALPEEESNASSTPNPSSIGMSEPQIEPMMPEVFNRRPFPQTGRHRLSTIASVETFNTQAKSEAVSAVSEVSQDTIQGKARNEDTQTSESGDTFDLNKPLFPGKRTSLKRRLTTHADLISVLSLPKAGNHSIQSARSIRTNRSKLATATIDDLMKELGTDEMKYMRELRTLVDGVIPVLLTCVLSKTDSAVAAGLFNRTPSGSEDPNVTRPIVDMGIALERLKSLHKRIPLQDPERLLTWAQSAQKMYVDYLKAWRMGFQDVVVNLAPAADATSPTAFDKEKSKIAEEQSLYNGLPRNDEGDVVNGDGERVDVAFLLKRPLVRLKYLAKTFKGINFIRPSVQAADLADRYQELVNDARLRSNEERARLEDEAAANIDPTRARDPKTLAPATGVTIDRTRRVRARDYFNMEMQHSSGQRLDCRVELLMRDDESGSGAFGDVLLCEVDGSGRWLLLPPILSDQVSARNGDLKGEIVVMIRGLNSLGQEWREMMSLITDDEQVGFEWVQMLGLTPIPPKLEHTQSFIKRHERPQSALITHSSDQVGEVKSRTPSPREIEIPIGEQPRGSPRDTKSELPDPLVPRVRPSSTSSPSKLSRSNEAHSHSAHSREPSAGPVDLNEALNLAGQSPASTLRRQRARKYSRTMDGSPTTPKASLSRQYTDDGSRVSSCPGNTKPSDLFSKIAPPSPQSESPVFLGPGEDVMSLPSRPKSQKPIADGPNSPNKLTKVNPLDTAAPTRPEMHRRTSSVPSMNLPSIPKVRNASRPASTESSPIEDMGSNSRSGPIDTGSPKSQSRYRKLRKRAADEPSSPISDHPPSPPAHTQSPIQLRGSKTPALSPVSPKQHTPKQRRSSSPLKHEYEPSTASDSPVSDDSATEDPDTLSDTTSDEELEDGDAPTPLLPVGAVQKFGKISPQGSIYSLPNATLSPSQSASQAPFRAVPQQPSKATKTIASIFSWSEKGSWDPLHPDECSIVITPGLIEAFEMSAEHSRPRTGITDDLSYDAFVGLQPLVALELTPLVPLRRGTALDISIRSPPIERSKITSGNNIMFRSRSTEECEALYAMINTSRINNPTYIALQNARAHTETLSRMDRHNSGRNSGSRWGWGSSRSSYRASSGRGASSVAISESSVGSLSSAFSALRRFGGPGNSRLFNISKSTISSRAGGASRSNSLYSSSSGSSTPLPPLPEGLKGSPGIGLTNAKIRLYHRETANRWRDMGSARLTITHAPPADPMTPTPANTNHTGGGQPGNQKRIVVVGKSKGECLLDVCLGESCFERIARTGIAISVWEDIVGPNGEIGQVLKEGGVGSGKRGVFMVQMKSEAETAYTFSLVGKLRY